MIENIAGLTSGLSIQPTTTSGSPADADPEAFGESLAAAIDQVDQVRETADTSLAELSSGEDVDLHGTMIALEKADITLRTMVSVRDKVIGAYEAVMNMAI